MITCIFQPNKIVLCVCVYDTLSGIPYHNTCTCLCFWGKKSHVPILYCKSFVIAIFINHKISVVIIIIIRVEAIDGVHL